MARQYTLDWYLERRRAAPKKEIAVWAAERVMQNYFSYRLDGKRKVGYCTACDADICPEKAVKRRFLACPNCGAQIKAKEEHECDIYEQVLVGYLERYDEYLLHRIFRVGRALKDRKAELRIEEAQMQVLKFPLIAYDSGFARGFSRETPYKNDNAFTRYGSWTSKPHGELWEHGSIGSFAQNIFQATLYTFPKNLQAVFLGTRWEHCSLWELAESCTHFNLRNALLEYARTPQIEYVIKLKLYKIAASLIHREILHGDSNNVIKFLGLNTAAELKYVIERNMTGRDLEIYHNLLEKKLPVSEASFKLYRSMRGIWDKPEKILELMSAQSFFDYYLAQKEIRPKLAYKVFLQDYFDHIRVVKGLGLDIHDTMYCKPKDFYTLHENLSLELSERQNKAKYEKVDKVLKTEKSFAFKNKALALIVPTSAKEIVAEGKAQNHCVGTYLDRVADKRSIIVFIRKVENITAPFYTMEINPETMTVVQCRGFKNCEKTPEVKEFVELYTKSVLDKKRKKKAA